MKNDVPCLAGIQQTVLSGWMPSDNSNCSKVFKKHIQ